MDEKMRDMGLELGVEQVDAVLSLTRAARIMADRATEGHESSADGLSIAAYRFAQAAEIVKDTSLSGAENAAPNTNEVN